MSPVPIRIEVMDGRSVLFTWEDEESTEIDADVLRAACMCAGCREPAGKEATAATLAGPVPVTIADAELVGGYAMKFVFGPDGHSTGIYPFAALREIGTAQA